MQIQKNQSLIAIIMVIFRVSQTAFEFCLGTRGSFTSLFLYLVWSDRIKTFRRNQKYFVGLITQKENQESFLRCAGPLHVKQTCFVKKQAK